MALDGAVLGGRYVLEEQIGSGGYDRACKEGPVYRAADVDWSALPSQLHYAIA